MNIYRLEQDIQRNKDKSPETYNEISNVTVPLHMFYHKLISGINQLEKEKYGINHSELDVLSSLKMSENDDYILSPTKLQESLLFSGAALTKILKKLEEKKYIIRINNKFDKRSKLVQLTNLGRQIHDKAMVDVLNFEEKCLSSLSQKERQTMKDLFVKILKTIN